MRNWIRQQFGDVVFWVSVVSSIAAIAYGYSEIRGSQVRLEEKCAGLDGRLLTLENRLEKLMDMHLTQQKEQQGARIDD